MTAFLVASASLALALMPTPVVLIVASAVYGLTVGNVTTLSPIIVRREFGAASFGADYGLAAMAIQLISAFGPSVFGFLRDAFGGYGPVLLIAEGLTYYLTKDDGIALLRRVVEHFPSGELHFDVCNWLGIKLQKINPIVRRTGSTLHWAINEPNDILDAVTGVHLLAATAVFETEEFRHLSNGSYRTLGKIMLAVPTLRAMSQFHRYAF